MKYSTFKIISVTMWLTLLVFTLIWEGPEVGYLRVAGIAIVGFMLGAWFPRPEVRRRLAIDIREAIAEETPTRERALKEGIYE